MRKLFSHPDAIMAALAAVLLCVLLGFYYWAIDTIVLQVRQALIPAQAQNAPMFNISGAEKLDLRGLLGQSPASATTLIPGAGNIPAQGIGGGMGAASGAGTSASGQDQSAAATDQQILQAFGASVPTSTSASASVSTSAPAITTPVMPGSTSTP